MPSPSDPRIPTALRCTRARAGIALAAGLSFPASAGIAILPQAILSPFDQAQVSIEWSEPVLRAGGFVRWANPTDMVTLANLDTNIFDIQHTPTGLSVVLPVLFAEHQPLVLGYAQTPTSGLLFRSDDDWAAVNLDIVRVTPTEYRIYAPGLAAYLDGRDPYDSAMIIVRFAQLPAPGAAAMLGLMPVLVRRRR
jgi:hypothetical protein